MKLERTIFFLTLILCICAVVAAYRYRESVIVPKMSVVSSTTMSAESNEVPSTEENANFTASEQQESDTTSDGETVANDAGNVDSGEQTTVGEESSLVAESATDDTDDTDVADVDATDDAESDMAESDTVMSDEGMAADLPMDKDADSQFHVYHDSLTDVWQDWSWDTTIDRSNATPVMDGDSSIAITYDNGWGAFWLSTIDTLDSNDYDILRFWVHGGDAGGQPMRVSLADGTQTLLDSSIEIIAEADSWQQVDIPLLALDAASEIGGIVWQDSLGSTQEPFYIDQISFVKLDTNSVAEAANSATQPIFSDQQLTTDVSSITVNVSVDSDRRPISPDIYGINFGSDELVANLGHTVRRWGGNATTRYNWKLDVSNRASDWYFENIADETEDVSALPNGSSADKYIATNQGQNVKTIVTMPMIGWTPKSRDFACSYPVDKYNNQQSIDQWNPTCGNGVTTSGEDITADPADTSIEIGPQFVTDWIEHLTTSFGTADSGGVSLYSLDNEPMLWHITHRDVHPEPVGYDELLERTVEYASAIKTADPSSMTLGPAVWGWTAYFESAKDQASSGSLNSGKPDFSTHQLPLIPWYLQQLNQYEKDNGVRLLDYLDIHYYPQTEGVALNTVGTADTQERRLRSTRSLWDESYTDESWINEPVRLIPRLREWIDEYYPGTKLAISEYNWGGLEHVNGALTQAEVLGIFGREGVDLATLWDPIEAGTPFTYAFQMYRNYDGDGGEFGDTSIRSSSSDASTLSVYSAQRSTDDALTILIINKGQDELTADIQLDGFLSSGSARRFRYGSEEQSAIQMLDDLRFSNEQLTDSFPGSSMTLFVISPAE